MRSLVRRLLAVRLLVAGLALLAFGAAAPQQVLPVPPLTGRIVDSTGTLTPEQRDGLERDLTSIEHNRGAQIAILMLSSTQGEAIEAFSLRVARTWQLGRRGVDDGILIVVAKDDRRIRVEIGYGLERAIPNGVAEQIVTSVMAPRFRSGDFSGGLKAAIDAVRARLPP
jgi:uncharacterized protein